MQPNHVPRNRSSDTRHILSISGLIFSSLLLLSIAIYTISARQALSSKGSILPSFSSRPLVTCKTPTHTLGDATDTLMSGGLKRTFLVHLAPNYGVQPQALVIAYHGYSWTAADMEHTTNMSAEADKAGFIVIYPQGVDQPPSWNAGVGAYGPTGDADDIQFTSDMLSYMEKNYCVDAHHVYATGFSLGGGMAYRVACALTNKFAAVGTVSGAYYPIPGGCSASRPIPIMEIHGAADNQAPYGGNPSLRMAAVNDYLNGWLTRDKCADTHDVFFQQGDISATEWTHCALGVAVVHYRVSDGGHSWPGSPNTTHVIDATTVLWEFFSKYSL